MSRILRFVVLCAWASYAGHPAQADDYPGKPIKIIIAQAAGGASDVLVRLLAQKLTENLGQQVVIENRPGAGANIGAEIAARSAPDGYTIFVASLPHAIAPSLYKNLSYDLLKDFAPIALAAEEQFCLVVHPSLPATNVKDFVAFLKRHSGAVSYGSTGNGAANHLAMELLQSMAGVKLVHVPYRGSSFALTDAINGRVPVLFVNLSPVSGHLQSGKLRALATTSAKRTPAAPELPTIAEAGLRDYEVSLWYGLLAPANTPQAIVQRLHGEVTRIIALPPVREQWAVLGAEPVSTTPEQFAAFIKDDIVKWQKVIRDSGAKMD